MANIWAPYISVSHASGMIARHNGRDYTTLLSEGTWVATLDTFPKLGYQLFPWGRIWGQVRLGVDDHQRIEEMRAMPLPSIHWTFRLDDFPNPSGFVQSFYGQQVRVAVHFRSHFSKPAQQWFTTQAYSAGQQAESLQIIIEELNALIKKDSLYDSQIFKEIELSTQTQEAINQSSSARHVFPINRGLIEDSFIRPWFDRWRAGDPEAFQVCAQWIWARLYRTVEGSLIHMGVGPWASAEGAVEKAYWVTLEDCDRSLSGGKFGQTKAFFLKSDIRKPALLLNHLARGRSSCDQFLHDDFLAQNIPVARTQQEQIPPIQWLDQVVHRLNTLLAHADWMKICEEKVGTIDRECDPTEQGRGMVAKWVQRISILEKNRELLETYYPQHIRPIKERAHSIKWGVWTGRILRKEQLVHFEWQSHAQWVAGIRKTWIKDCLDVLRKASRPTKNLAWTEDITTPEIQHSLSPLEIRNRRESLKQLDRELGALAEELCLEQEACTTEKPSTLGKERRGESDALNPAWRRRKFVEHIRIFMKIQVGQCHPTYQNASEEEIAEYRMLTLVHEADVSHLCLNAQKLKSFLIQEGQLTNPNLYKIKSRLKGRLQPLLPWFYRTEQGQKKNKGENT